MICDAGYYSDKLRTAIKRYYYAQPIIDPNRTHKRMVAKAAEVADWKAIYNRRTAVERLNGRLKAHRRLDSVRVRGRMKVRLHGILATVVLQAQALATGSRISVRSVGKAA